MGKRAVVSLAHCTIYHSEDPMVELTAKSCAKLGEMVLEGVNLEVCEGEFVYLIGRVGSGKSSLLKTLYGELPLVEGEGEVAGFNLRKLRRSQIPYLRRKVGIVFQDLQLLSDRDVEDNLSFVLRATGWKDKGEIGNRVDEVLSQVGLENKHHKMPFELSGGERQRLVIARALLNSPQIVLADEPTGNLDPITAESIVQLFHNIAASGTAIIMSTHNTNFIENHPSRTMLFTQGTIKEIDVDELLGTKSTI